MRLVTALLVALAAAVAFEAVARDPMFVRWLDPSVPLDATIDRYWQQAQADELDAVGLVDLGTMLFERGFPKDALDALRSAVDLDPDDPVLTEAWFRIGMIHQKRGDDDDARRAYGRCLDIRPGHGWCNFYQGLLEERSGHPKRAVEHFQTAFRHAPALADPELNSALQYSKLALAARIGNYRTERFELLAPMSYLEPGKIRSIRAELFPEPEAAEPGDAATADAVPGEPRDSRRPASAGSMTVHETPDSGSESAGAARTTPRTGPRGVRGKGLGRARPGASPPRPTPSSRGTGDQTSPYHIREVSPEARLRPLVPELLRWWAARTAAA